MQPEEDTAPVQPTAQALQFPMSNMQITPDGLIISHMLSGSLSFNQFFNEADMNTIVGKWLETRKEVAKSLAIVRDANTIKEVNKSKVRR